MNTKSNRGNTPISPPHVGLSLGWQLALYTSLAVALVMGAITVLQEVKASRRELNNAEESLRNSLIPLVADVEQAGNLKEVEDLILSFHHAYMDVGNVDHQLVLKDPYGNLIISTTDNLDDLDLSKFHHADVLVTNRNIPTGKARLTVLEDNSTYRSHNKARWRSWALHILVTLGSILIALQITIRYLVTAPLERLLDAIRKMEMGYWGDVEDVGGAWEIRWINWRFHNMGLELQRTVHHLLEAERKASPATNNSATEYELNANGSDSRVEGVSERPITARHEFLRRRCQDLEAGNHSSPRQQDLARAVFEHHAFTAESLGDIPLKNRLENAAFKILDPGLFGDLESQIGDLVKTRETWLGKCKSDLASALNRKMVPVQDLQCRYKHTAGVWKKMKAKGLNFDQVHDLFAVRVVVPTETDCYFALGVAHDIFEPVVGRFKDYVAEPKANGYKSIHTCVRAEDGQVLEIQIRSLAMHHSAEIGAASHLQYKMSGSAAVHSSENSGPWNRVFRKLLSR